MYMAFLRPLLEYAGTVWDNCNQFEKATNTNRSSKNCNRLTRYVSLNRLYRETDWLPLSDRRLHQKLISMYKINRMVPSDLTSLFLRNTDHPLEDGLKSDLYLNHVSETDKCELCNET